MLPGYFDFDFNYAAFKSKGYLSTLYFGKTQILPDYHFEEAQILPEYFDVAANDNFIFLSISKSQVDHLQQDCYSNIKDCLCL